jgi:hypothetical protein
VLAKVAGGELFIPGDERGRGCTLNRTPQSQPNAIDGARDALPPAPVQLTLTTDELAALVGAATIVVNSFDGEGPYLYALQHVLARLESLAGGVVVGLSARTGPSANDLDTAALQLARTDRGQAAAAGLLNWLREYGLGLDALNQVAVITLLRGVFGAHTGTVRDLLADAAAAGEGGGR